MPPVAQHKRIYRGEAKTFRVLVTDEETGDPLDLSTLAGDDDLVFEVSEKDGALTATFQKTISDSGGIAIVTPHEDENLGLADITIDTADTANVNALKQRYDLKLVIDDETFVVIPPSDFTIVEVVVRPAVTP